MTRFAAMVALAISTIAPSVAAQDNSAAMRAMIAQMRQTAKDMQGKLPQSDIDEMLRSADELERENAKGAFTTTAAAKDPNDIVVHMEQVHNSRYEWLIRETACAGYQWETWRVTHLDTGDRDAERDVLCKRAYALYEEYFYLARDGNRAPAMVKLAAFDKAAHAAVDFYERR